MLPCLPRPVVARALLARPLDPPPRPFAGSSRSARPAPRAPRHPSTSEISSHRGRLRRAAAAWPSYLTKAGGRRSVTGKRPWRIVGGLADGVGFEPTEPFSSLVFKTSALNRSATHPCTAGADMAQNFGNSRRFPFNSNGLAMPPHQFSRPVP
jgi:hypothetical protein